MIVSEAEERAPTANKIESPTMKAMVLDEIMQLDGRGYTLREIGEQLVHRCGITLSYEQVRIYLRQLRTKFQERCDKTQEERVNEKLAQYRDIRKECWLAYERSKLDAERIMEEEVNPTLLTLSGPGSVRVKADAELEQSLQRMRRIITREGRLPGNEYLKTIVQTLNAECQLLGLFQKIELNATFNSINLLDMQPPPDPLEKAKQEALCEPSQTQSV